MGWYTAVHMNMCAYEYVQDWTNMFQGRVVYVSVHTQHVHWFRLNYQLVNKNEKISETYNLSDLKFIEKAKQKEKINKVEGRKHSVLELPISKNNKFFIPEREHNQKKLQQL